MMILVIGLVIVMSIYVPTISSKIIAEKTKVLTEIEDHRLIPGNVTSDADDTSRKFCYICTSPCSSYYCCDGAQCCYYLGGCYCCV